MRAKHAREIRYGIRLARLDVACLERLLADGTNRTTVLLLGLRIADHRVLTRAQRFGYGSTLQRWADRNLGVV